MANNLNSNPLFVDTAAELWNSTKGEQGSRGKSVRLVQWVDDNGDLVHDSTLTLIINGVTLVVKIQPVNDQLGFGAVAWQLGPFNPGIYVSDFNVSVMATGNLHVWVD